MCAPLVRAYSACGPVSMFRLPVAGERAVQHRELRLHRAGADGGGARERRAVAAASHARPGGEARRAGPPLCAQGECPAPLLTTTLSHGRSPPPFFRTQTGSIGRRCSRAGSSASPRGRRAAASRTPSGRSCSARWWPCSSSPSSLPTAVRSTPHCPPAWAALTPLPHAHAVGIIRRLRFNQSVKANGDGFDMDLSSMRFKNSKFYGP